MICTFIIDADSSLVRDTAMRKAMRQLQAELEFQMDESLKMLLSQETIDTIFEWNGNGSK